MDAGLPALRREHAAEEVRRRVDEERLRLARELHDVVAHSIAVINFQAGVAVHVLDRRPGQARVALLAIKQASGEALQELRATLGVLRQLGEQGGSRASVSVTELAGGQRHDLWLSWARRVTPHPERAALVSW